MLASISSSSHVLHLSIKGNGTMNPSCNSCRSTTWEDRECLEVLPRSRDRLYGATLSQVLPAADQSQESYTGVEELSQSMDNDASERRNTGS